jgi:hypothetical protein
MDSDMCRVWHCAKCHPCGEGFDEAMQAILKAEPYSISGRKFTEPKEGEIENALREITDVLNAQTKTK